MRNGGVRLIVLLSASITSDISLPRTRLKTAMRLARPTKYLISPPHYGSNNRLVLTMQFCYLIVILVYNVIVFVSILPTPQTTLIKEITNHNQSIFFFLIFYEQLNGILDRVVGLDSYQEPR